LAGALEFETTNADSKKTVPYHLAKKYDENLG